MSDQAAPRYGIVDQQLLGDETVWDRVGVVKHPTRASFIEMRALRTFQESHKHKDHREVAIADTYTMIVRAQVNTLDELTAD